jgi:hypothetical protein
MWMTPTTQDAKNNGAESQRNRNTPPLNAQVKMFPTPRVGGQESYGTRAKRKGHKCAMWNYEECNNPDSVLHKIIPRNGGRNEQCIFFNRGNREYGTRGKWKRLTVINACLTRRKGVRNEFERHG